MRRLFIVSLGILVSGTILLAVLLAIYHGSVQQGAPSGGEQLPDLIVLAQDQKRSFLIGEARRQLKYITQKFDNIFNTLLVRANCEVVEGRLEQDCENADAAPMMIASCLVPLADEKQCFFFVWCFNPHREADAIVLVGETAEGATVRIRYQSRPKVKCGALVGTFADKTTLVSLDELFQAGKVLRSNGQIDVRISTETTGAPVVPDLPVLAVALHDRNGKLSNFVPVCRSKAVRVWHEGQPGSRQ